MNILDVNKLSKQIGSTKILNDISFSIQEGEFVGLIGPNGAGKTTIIKCITGQLLISEKSVFVHSHDIVCDSLTAKKYFGYAFDPAILPVQLTGSQFIDFIAAARYINLQKSDISSLVEMLALEDKINDYIGTYSQGMKQKISIICALIGKPSLIILDESLNGLDPLSSYNLKNYLKEATQNKESSVLLSSHLIDSIEKYCSKIIMIYKGTICKIWSREELAIEKERTCKDLEQIFVDTIINKHSFIK